MRDEPIKTFIVLAFVALIIYWGLTGFSVTGNWVALVGPIILGYLFKPASNGNGKPPKKNDVRDRERNKKNTQDVDRNSIHRPPGDLRYIILSRQSY